MVNRLIKAPQPPHDGLEASRRASAEEWRGSWQSHGAARLPWERYIAALRRYKWLILAIIVVGTALGVAATRLLTPEYEAQATIWISTTEQSRREDRGPIRSEELVNPTAWVELFKSFAVVDAVVRQMALYLAPGNAADSVVFTDFALGDQIRPGAYALTVDRARGRYLLATDEGVELERGALGDSIGRTVGFRWAPEAALLGQRGTIEFLVVNPRDVSVSLRDRVEAVLPERSNFLRVTLAGTDPIRTAAILNTWITEFVSTAAELKKRNLVGLAEVLDAQLQVAQQGLSNAENALRAFRTRTITLPSETRASAEGEALSAPVMVNFFSHRAEYDDVRHDRQVLEDILRQVRAGTLAPDALLSVPSIDGFDDGLRSAIAELHSARARLDSAQALYTDEHQTVRALRQSITELEERTIPERAERLLALLQRREQDLRRRIDDASRELQSVPDRAIEEQRLRRDVAAAENLYTTLQNRHDEVRLAEASAVPDVSILDDAVAPQWPTKNRAPAIMFLAFLLSVAAAIAVALLLDHLDRRFRYPEQAAQELGLSVIGAVPPIDARRGALDPAAESQVTEAFRSIRLHLEQAFGTSASMVLTISSPGVGDGKSLVSSRLAMSLAEAGHRTVLIDGDIRRGTQHALLSVSPRPGLLDYLGGDASIKQVLQASSHDNLSVIARGAHRERGPELLTSDGMSHLIATLEEQFDAIIVDSPPLGANIDPLALGTATGNMLLVLRSGETDRHVAEAKVRTLEYFPIRILGAVLNAFPLSGAYQQYHYLYWYGDNGDEEPVTETASRAGGDGDEAETHALESHRS